MCANQKILIESQDNLIASLEKTIKMQDGLIDILNELKAVKNLIIKNQEQAIATLKEKVCKAKP